jgi:CubicO group peptidase (beta-lactamase class C family)
VYAKEISVLSRRACLQIAGAGLGLAATSAKAASVVALAGAAGAARDFARSRPDLVSARALSEAQAYSDQLGGSALCIWRAGHLVYESYAAGVDATTPLTTYSMAKSVLGLVYGLALEDGVVGSLDDAVGLYIDEWRGDPRGAITVRQLLQMRSGLKLYSLARREPEAIALLSGDHVTETALATPLERPPGALFEYANVNSQLAGTALDRALRRRGLAGYSDYLERKLWRPLGQGAATLSVEFPGGEPRFFAGLQATAHDWLRLGVMFAQEGRFAGRAIVPAGWIRQMAAPSANPNYGIQLWRGSPWAAQRSYGPGTPQTVACKEPYLASDMVFFDGSGGQRVYVSAGLRLVIVRTGKMSWDWEDSSLPNTIIRGLA